jgi:hypothetical protein
VSRSRCISWHGTSLANRRLNKEGQTDSAIMLSVSLQQAGPVALRLDLLQRAEAFGDFLPELSLEVTSWASDLCVWC